MKSGFQEGLCGFLSGESVSIQMGWGRFHVEKSRVQRPSAHPQPLYAFVGGGFWREGAG